LSCWKVTKIVRGRSNKWQLKEESTDHQAAIGGTTRSKNLSTSDISLISKVGMKPQIKGQFKIHRR
jgi:hypothetical protein